MSAKIEEATRQKVAVFVPQLIEITLKSYLEFMTSGHETDLPGEETKSGKAVTRTPSKIFAEHHNAGKVALGHLDSLLKLAALIKVDTGESGMAAALLLEAKRETRTFRSDLEECPDEDSLIKDS